MDNMSEKELQDFVNELENFAKNCEHTCKDCTCGESKNKKPETFNANIFRGFSHKPMVIYGRIYSDCTVLKVTSDVITVIVNDLDDDWLDKTIITASTKTFNLPVEEYGNFPGSKVTVENYYNFWMPLAEFMCVGIKNAADVNNISDIPKKFKFTKLNSVPKTEYNSSSFVNKYDNNNISKIAKKVDEKKNFEEAANKFYLDSFKNAVDKLNISVTIKNYIANTNKVCCFGNKFGEIDANTYYIDSDTALKVKAYFTGYDAKRKYLRFTKAATDEKIFIYLDEIARGKYTIFKDYSPKQTKTKTFDEYMKEKNNFPKPKKVTSFDDFAREPARCIASNDPTSTIVFGVDDDTSIDDILNKLFGNNK